MKKLYMIVLFIAFLPTVVLSERLEIKPGVWETTMTRTNPLNGQQVTETQKECVKETAFDPVALMEGMQGCKLTQNELIKSSLQFTMQCDMSGVSSTVRGQYKVEDDKGAGSMNIQMNMAGQVMEMSMSWESRRLGDCETPAS